MAQKTPVPEGTLTVLCAAGLLVAGLVVRMLAARGDLWLDELWSISIANRLPRALDALTLAHDNNHALNTLFVRLLLGSGFPIDPLVVRSLSVVTGTAAVGLLAMVARRWGRPAAWVALILGGSCYLLVHYSSEERGYMPMLCFLLLCMVVAREGIDDPKAWRLGLFGASSVLAFTAHLLFVAPAVAIGLWIGLRATGSFWQRLLCLLRWEAIPLAGAGATWVFRASRLYRGGADEEPQWRGAAQLFSSAVGGPLQGRAAILVALLVAGGIILVAVRWLPLADRVLVLVGAFLLPASFILTGARFGASRYFLGSVPFVLLAAACGLGRALAANARIWRTTGALALAATVFGSARHIDRLLRDQRGHYTKAVERMASDDAAAEIQVAGDHDFRVGWVLDLYGNNLPPGRRLVYHPLAPAPPATEWFVAHSLDPDAQLAATIVRANHPYRLVERFASAPLSGTVLFLYRRSGIASGEQPAFELKAARSGARRARTRTAR